jgi:hypothetical protein
MTSNTYQFSIKTKRFSQSGKVLFDRRAPVEIFYDNDSAEIKRNSLLSNKKETTY